MRTPIRAHTLLTSARTPIALLSLAALGFGFGCDSDGTPPPRGRLYFPIALEISPDYDADGDGDFLVVANSNFDLRYRSGALQTYDLDALDRALVAQCASLAPDDRKACGVIAEEDVRDDLGEDITPMAGLLASEVLIGSFSDGLSVAPGAGGGSRIYMPVRSDGNLSYVDLSPAGALTCGDDADSTLLFGGPRHECAGEFREAEDGAARDDGLTVPPDPVAVAVGSRTADPEDGNFIVMAHRGGRLSLFWETVAGARPELVDTLEGLPEELVEIQRDPLTGTLWAANAFDPVVARAGLALGDRREDSFIFRNSDLLVSGIDIGSGLRGDTRVVRFDPRPGVRRAYVLARLPRAVLVVDIDESVGALAVRERIPVGLGPSRMEIAELADGRMLAFVTCFDSRDLYVIDLDAQRLVGIARSLGGPFELAVDVERERVYVGDFRSSVIRVLDLGPLLDCMPNAAAGVECSPTSLGIVGRPRAVQELI